VTCAQVSAIQSIESRQITLGHYDIDYESVMGAFSEAADSSVKTGDPVFVVFHDGTH